MFRQEGGSDSGKYDACKHHNRKNILHNFLAARVGPKDDTLNFVVDSPTRAKVHRLRVARQIVKVGLEEPEGL